MNEAIKEIMFSERESIAKLLSLLEEQHSYIISNDVFKMDAIVLKLKDASIEIAKFETERRKLTGENSMRDFVSGTKDKDLKECFLSIKSLIENAKFQKDTNEMLIKQSIVFVNKMLSFINPNRDIKTYSSSGRVRR